MNWNRGLLRLWVLITVLWLGFVGYLASDVFLKRVPFRGDYQYEIQTKDMPWNIDWSKPLYEIIYAPGKGLFPDAFSPVDEKYIQEWDARVKAGNLIRLDFSDSSALYLNAGLSKQDQEYLSRLFWDRRWRRYWSKIAPWLAGAFGPPLSLLILGFAIGWVRRGFATHGATP
jgi:hypothetical protein